MRVPSHLASAFGEDFEKLVASFAVERGLLPDAESLQSTRFLSRSVVPHIEKLSEMFNRIEEKETPGKSKSGQKSGLRREAHQQKGLDPYWKESSNPANLRLAYFLYFMPSNLFRTAAVWAELARLGMRWPEGLPLRGIELGAGPASATCGIAAGEHFAPLGIPKAGNWALIEQDKAMLELGANWAPEYFKSQGFPDWDIRKFHRTLDLRDRSLLPPSAPKFSLWVMSYFLNEAELDAKALARTLLSTWERHLEEEGIVVMVEPALKLQSRRLLELRQAILELQSGEKQKFQILTPCLGHQNCGALAAPEDWCHEEVTWWRPPYFRTIDKMAGLDRKTLPFSYLVLTRSRRPREEILPGISQGAASSRYRLVSPAHLEGRDQEFFICGEDGKRRARYRGSKEEEKLERGDILLGADVRGDTRASRIESTDRVKDPENEG